MTIFNSYFKNRQVLWIIQWTILQNISIWLQFWKIISAGLVLFFQRQSYESILSTNEK